jgi:hypothetical protein
MLDQQNPTALNDRALIANLSTDWKIVHGIIPQTTLVASSTHSEISECVFWEI